MVQNIKEMHKMNYNHVCVIPGNGHWITLSAEKTPRPLSVILRQKSDCLFVKRVTHAAK